MNVLPKYGTEDSWVTFSLSPVSIHWRVVKAGLQHPSLPAIDKRRLARCCQTQSRAGCSNGRDQAMETAAACTKQLLNENVNVMRIAKDMAASTTGQAHVSTATQSARLSLPIRSAWCPFFLWRGRGGMEFVVCSHTSALFFTPSAADGDQVTTTQADARRTSAIFPT